MIFVRCLTWKVATVKRFLHLPSQLDLYLGAPIQLLNRDQIFFLLPAQIDLLLGCTLVNSSAAVV